jgi:site-specific DNA-methyltransferase (cytosine-N4-specific)
MLKGSLGESLRESVQLIFTSPPFLLNRKKKYGNFTGQEYRDWFVANAPIWSNLLTNNGSIVVEMGNAWEPGAPVQSLLCLEALLDFVKHPTAGLKLCQQFICYNPSRLPSPAAWVTVRRIRCTDSYTYVWWMSKSDYPKADNRKVLREYSPSMKSLIKRQKFNSGKRPSQHDVSKGGFLKDNSGSIPHNVLTFPNTSSNDAYLVECRKRKIAPHPARMNPKLAEFFIKFLTDEGDMVLDPFAGSNTTGYIAEKNKRRWLSIDNSKEYAEHAMIRFG